MRHLLAIEPNGDVTMIYSDDTVDLMEEIGRPTITRATFVEPAADGSGWTAEIATEGLVLGPFRLRSEALEREVAWLEARYF